MVAMRILNDAEKQKENGISGITNVLSSIKDNFKDMKESLEEQQKIFF